MGKLTFSKKEQRWLLSYSSVEDGMSCLNKRIATLESKKTDKDKLIAYEREQITKLYQKIAKSYKKIDELKDVGLIDDNITSLKRLMCQLENLDTEK